MYISKKIGNSLVFAIASKNRTPYFAMPIPDLAGLQTKEKE